MQIWSLWKEVDRDIGKINEPKSITPVIIGWYFAADLKRQ